MNDNLLQRRYEKCPYESRAISYTHPSRTSALAKLLGLSTPAVQTARVLDLGCASGGNIIPMAAGFPDARFVGIDFAAQEIEQGNALIRELGLTNIELRLLDIRQVSRELGEFDYILAHGVFSWTPPDVREKLLQVCNENLSPNGLAYICFNCLPGKSEFMAVRQMLLAHVAGISDETQQAIAARRQLNVLREMLNAQETPFAKLLKKEIEGLLMLEDCFLLHDCLATINEPMFFRDFMSQAEAHGLQYVWEAMPSTTSLQQFPPQVRQTIVDNCRNVIELEQSIDVLRRRALRKCLLAKKELKIDRVVSSERLRGLYAASPVTMLPDGAFALPDNQGSARIDVPAARQMLQLMIAAWPRSLPVEELAGPSFDRNAMMLVEMMLLGLVELDTSPPSCVSGAGPRPTASALARLQARKVEVVTHLRHGAIRLAPAQRSALLQLDGAHPRQALGREVDSLLDDLAKQALLVS